MRRESIVLICAALALLALPAAGARGSASSPPIKHPQPLQRRDFSLFRTAPERLPAPIGACLATYSGHGFNPALAQRAQPPRGQRPLWLVPGRGQILLAQRLAHGCAIVTATTWSVIRRGLIFTFLPSGEAGGVEGKLPPDNSRAVGLVADGVRAVRLSGHLLAPVRNNVFSIDIGARRLSGAPVLVKSG